MVTDCKKNLDVQFEQTCKEEEDESGGADLHGAPLGDAGTGPVANVKASEDLQAAKETEIAAHEEEDESVGADLHGAPSW